MSVFSKILDGYFSTVPPNDEIKKKMLQKL